MQQPTKDHSLFGIDVIDELVEEHTQLDPNSDKMPSFVKIINLPKPKSLYEHKVVEIKHVKSDSANQGLDLTRAESDSSVETKVESD
ncbi:hypothetical protein CR513_17424, partial [Mucuna pruriens]